MQTPLFTIDSFMTDENVIMLIDDSPDSLKLLTDILVAQGFTVRQALSGSVALSSIKHCPPDLIILDIRMPEMDGLEVCTQLKDDSTTSEIPVIFISGLEESDEKVRAFESGGVDYITKPFHEDEVLARVKIHIVMSKMKKNLEELVSSRTVKLEESNTALKVLLEHRQMEREKLEESVISHINSLVVPYVRRLRETGLEHKQVALVNVIESNLEEVTSQFSGKLYSKAEGLTRREMEVASLIKMGKTNMEIADLLYVSEHAISFHRQNLRKKLGLLGQKVNLVAYLNEIILK